MKERFYEVFLDNWMINAGIIGFLNILLTDKEKEKIINNQNKTEFSFRDEKILISHNKINFASSVLADNGNFSKLFFEKAFNNYGRYGRYIERLQKIKKSLQEFRQIENEEEKKKSKSQIINEWDNKGSFTFLEKKYEEQLKSSFKLGTKLNEKIFSKENLKELVSNIEKCLNVLKNKSYYQDFFENDVQFYLSNYFADDKTGIKKQAGFLNISVKGSKEKHFFTNVIDPIIKKEVQYEKDNKCIISDAPAKKKSTYNSGLVPFIGHPGSNNHFWLNTPNELPLSELYELIYWCTFAGFTDITKGNNFRFLFCNQDNSVIELWSANYKLSKEFSKDAENTISYLNFLINLILSEKEKSTYEVQNTVIIDIQNTKGNYAKIHSLYISREKAKFLSDNKNLKKLISLTKTRYSDNGIIKNIGSVVLEKILHDQLNYNYLQRLTKLAIAENNDAIFIQRQLQNANNIILNYMHSFNGGGSKMNLKENYDVYNHGKHVASIIKKRNDENKIRGIIHKCLAYLKTGNINSFMNLFLRIHMAYGLQTPSEVIKIMNNEINFNAFGYSFINGLLNENIKEEGEE